MLIKRRTFLQSGSLAAAGFLVPDFLKALEKPMMIPQGNKALVILQLSGGNDGLNTVIPVRNDIYYRSRPHLGIQPGNSLALNGECNLHASLPAFKELYDEGHLAILNSVGYPNPDRSHFRSMDIWQTASNSNEYLQTGWLGRYLDAQCHGCDKPTQALEMDDVLSLAMKGNEYKGIALKDPARLYNTSNENWYRDLQQAQNGRTIEKPVDYLYKVMGETLSGAEYIYTQSKLRPSSASYPSTPLGKNLHTIASLILSDINTSVYYVSLGSFDTHVNQAAQQQRLFGELNDAVKVFVQDLKENNRFREVALVTFSEFGRRVTQNASGGTDHGTANNMFVISGGLQRKGLVNPLPDLTNLDDGDLRYQVDFKSVYATLLHKWLQADDQLILGKKFEQLDFF